MKRMVIEMRSESRVSARVDCAIAHVLAAKSWELGRCTSLLALRSTRRIEPWFLPYPIRNVIELAKVVVDLVGLAKPGTVQEEIRRSALEIVSSGRLTDQELLERGMLLIRKASCFCERPSSAHAHSLHLLLFLLRAAGDMSGYERLKAEMDTVAREATGSIRYAYEARHLYERASALRYAKASVTNHRQALALYKKALEVTKLVEDPQFGMDHIMYGSLRCLFLTSVNLEYWHDALEAWRSFNREFPDFGETHLPLDYEFIQTLERHMGGQLSPIKEIVLGMLFAARENPEFPLSVKNRINRSILYLQADGPGDRSLITLDRHPGVGIGRRRTADDFLPDPYPFRQVLVVSPRSSSLPSSPPRVALDTREPGRLKTCV